MERCFSTRTHSPVMCQSFSIATSTTEIREIRSVTEEHLCLELPSLSGALGPVARARPSPNGPTKSRKGVATPLRDFVGPFGDGLALATGPSAPDNDGNSKHRCSSVTERISLISVVEVAIEKL